MTTSRSPARHLQRVLGVRMRSAIAAAGVVAVALAVVSAGLLILLQRTLIGAVQAAAEARAAEVTRLVTAEGVSGLSADLASIGAGRHVVQVLDPAGRVVAASSTGAAATALSVMRPAPGRLLVTPVSRLATLDPDEQFLVVAQGVVSSGTTYVVVVAAPASAQQETVSTVARYLVVGYPVLLLVVGGATFLFVGRSLAPVERIRRQVAGIGSRQLDERIPVPPTGDEVARLALTMNSMLERLQAARDSQRRFVADASHELRSPLTTVRTGLDVAAADRTGRTWHDLSEAMQEDTARMTRLVEDLLQLAKLDEAGASRRVSDVDLDDVVQAELRRLRASTTLDVTSDTQPVRVSGDAAQLAQVLRNLTDNAARYARHRIRVRLATLGDWAVIEVDDDGPGIPEQERGRVFDRFVRLQAGRERTSGGSGLGLAIVKEIVTGHAGSVTATDAPLGGARFLVRLPRET